MASALQRKDGSVPLCGDTIAIAGGGAVRIELMVHFPAERSVQPFAAPRRRLKLG